MSVLHVLFVIATALFVLYADEQGLMWFLGKKQTLSKKSVHLLHILVSVGLAGLILTGGLMFIDRASYLLTQSVFLVKMGFVLALLINGFFIGSISTIATQKPYREVSSKERMRLLLSGGVSLVGWIGAGICGLLLSW